MTLGPVWNAGMKNAGTGKNVGMKKTQELEKCENHRNEKQRNWKLLLFGLLECITQELENKTFLKKLESTIVTFVLL
jgi:hypothetical protein